MEIFIAILSAKERDQRHGVRHDLLLTRLTFLSDADMKKNIQSKLRLERTCSVIAAENTRHVGKSTLKRNSALPNMSVDQQTYEIFSDGELLTCEPAEVLPIAQRYLLL